MHVWYAALIVMFFAVPPLHAAGDAPLALDIAGLSASGAQFCSIVQQQLEGTKLVSANVVHPTYESFKESKAEAQPLRTEQYVMYEDDGAKRNPIRISCKTKTADLLSELYGPQSATASNSCATIHALIRDVVFDGLSEDEKANLKISKEQIVLDDDDVQFMGSKWVEPYVYASAGEGGTLHLKSKSLLVAWNNLMFKMAPDRFRGTHYCHLITPEYLRRLILGEAPIPSENPS